MTLYFTSLPKAAARCACRHGALLLPLLAVEAEALVMPQRVTVISHGTVLVVEHPAPVPYLVAVGPVGFRFAPLPAPQAERPVFPALVPVTATSANSEPVFTNAPVVETPPQASEPLKKEPETRSSPPILPDDSKREIRAEDVLPFFQFPNSGPSTESGVPPAFLPARPSGSALPPSSATYQQK